MASGLLDDLKDAEERLRLAVQDVERLRELVASWQGSSATGGECDEGRTRDAANLASATQAVW